MTRYTHPDFEGLFPKASGVFTEVGGRQIGSSFFRTASLEDIEALGFTAYEPPVEIPGIPEVNNPVPYSVTRYQIMSGLALVGWITPQEALGTVMAGALPASIESMIEGMSEEEKFSVRMKWASFLHAYRDDPLVQALADLHEKTPEEIDDFFRMCNGIN